MRDRKTFITVGVVAEAVALLCFLIAATTKPASATAGSSLDQVTVEVPVSCSLTGTVNTEHAATMEVGRYLANIGETTFKVFCNDSNGFAIYAVGYTANSYGNNTMKPTTLDSATYGIATGTATNGNTSNWAMKLSTVSGTYTPTIHATEDNGNTHSFTEYHAVPSEYTKVASFSSNTDATVGATMKSTYAAYIAQDQAADTYTGKVKYTIVHPANAATPGMQISDLTYMQDFVDLSLTNRASVLASMADSTTYSLIDNRDNKTYAVAKMKDGNVWMAENLDLGRTTLTTDLTSANTNLANTVSAATFNSWKKETGSQEYDAGEFIPVTGTDATSGTPYGTLYNYFAASAGTISGDININNAQYDICPAGWRLPTGGNTGEFQALYAQYNSNALMRAPITNGGAAFSLAGNFGSGAPSSQGSNGATWSSTRGDNSSMYNLNLLGSMLVGTANTSSRDYGRSIRCILKSPPLSIYDLTYMQDFKDLSAEDKTSVLASMADSTTYNLIDNRDNKTYTVAKMIDGNVWMAENLDLGRTDLTTNLTSANTNLSTTVPAATFNSWKKTAGTSTYNAGEFIPVAGTDSISGTPYGTLYNYFAASAGTISGVEFEGGDEVEYDICPAGWKLPSEFDSLYEGGYFSVNAMRTPITNGGAAFGLAGWFTNDAPDSQGVNGRYWTSMANGGDEYYFLFISDAMVDPSYYTSGSRGLSIRCLAQ